MRPARKTNRNQPPRPLAEMNEFGRKMYELSEKSLASTKKRLTIEQINRLVAVRRGGIVK
jgi:hypothetical protein